MQIGFFTLEIAPLPYYSEMMKNSWKIYGNAIFHGNSMEIAGIFCVMKFANSSQFP